MLSTRHRQELVAIVALLLGVFVGLTLVPANATGPVGAAVGRFLWRYLGIGAALVPVLGIVLGLTGFGRFRALGFRRTSVLVAGLVVLAPFVVALLQGIRGAGDVPAAYENWTLAQRAAGVLPAMLAVVLTSVVGTAGAIILGLIALSGLTLFTFDWHPFRRLKPGAPVLEAGANERLTVPPGHVDDEPPVEPTPKTPTREVLSRFTKRRRVKPAPEDALDELPDLALLDEPPHESAGGDEDALEQLGQVLVQTLETFRVEGRIVGRTTGPVVTQFEVAPAAGVKVGRIAALADDLALAMRAKSIRIVAPIPGKGAVGVEVPNPTPRMVALRELIEAPEWDGSRALLPIALGRNLEGKTVIADLAQMPHLLIAGATGAGKSVCINTVITSLIYRYTPRELRMLMIDPKMVELSMYNTLPHLRHPVVTDNKQAAKAFKWAMLEMERRYELFHANGARNVHDFNRKVAAGKDVFLPERRKRETENDPDGDAPETPERYQDGALPYIVIIVDELADLMMTVQGEVEKPLAILAQKARATGIHLILSTQRPSVNVITGLIKANFPSRIAFRVASKVDSRTILDQNGAEALLGNGDLLFLPPGKSEAIRVQGAYIGTEESERLMEWYEERKAARDEALAKEGLTPPESGEEDILDAVRDVEAEEAATEAGVGSEDYDELFREAAEICISHQLGSTSLLQRKLRIGYGRAARIIDQLHEAGVLGPPDGSKPREVLLALGDVETRSFAGRKH